MKKDWKNNSSIYLSKNSKAYMYCLYPILILLCFLVIFLFVGKIEVIIRGNARIIGEEVMIQATNEENIEKNELKENKKVKKGETLVTYDNKKYVTEQEKIDKKLTGFEEEKKVLGTLQLSLEENKNHFLKPDAYGYYHKFSEYQSSLETFEDQIKLLSSNETIKNTNQTNVTSEMSKMIEEKNNYLNEMTELKNAISGDYTYFETSYSQLASKFNLIHETLKKGTKEDKKLQKYSSLSEIDTEIKQLSSEIETLKLNKVQSMAKEVKQEDPERLREEEKKLKETNLSQVKTSLSELNKQQEEVKEEKKALENMKATFEIKAPKGGVIHLNEEVDITSTQIPKGTTMASLFVSDSNKLEIESMIPANEINKVKVGGKFKIELDQKGVSKEVYKGKISEISQTSTVTEQGTFYVVKGVLDKDIKNVKYGEMGRLSIIVGKKSYVNYLKDVLFSK